VANNNVWNLLGVDGRAVPWDRTIFIGVIAGDAINAQSKYPAPPNVICTLSNQNIYNVSKI